MSLWQRVSWVIERRLWQGTWLAMFLESSGAAACIWKIFVCVWGLVSVDPTRLTQSQLSHIDAMESEIGCAADRSSSAVTEAAWMIERTRWMP
jgi:hypothetical protein